MLPLVDTHAHLDFPQFNQDREAVIEKAFAAGLEAIVNAGTGEESSRRSVELSKKYPRISASVGIHPHEAGMVLPGWSGRIEQMALLDCVVAVGETGLDYYRDRSPRDKQQEVFREHLRLAHRVHKPVIVHNRDAHADTLRIIREEGLSARSGVMHCFSGDWNQAEAYLNLGMYISLAGPLTYPRSQGLRHLLAMIPPDRLLLETDCPYLSPQAYRGKRNEPAYITLTYQRAALALKIEPGELARQIYLNAVRLFSDRLVDRS